MKKNSLASIIVFIGIISLIFLGCSKKNTEMPSTEMQTQTAQLSTESLTAQAANKIEGAVQVVPTGAKQAEQMVAPVAEMAIQITKPTPEQIQTALKNSGYYTGAIDGKLGPKSKKAIESFQKDTALVVDGKVGPKTWSKLQVHLNTSPEQKIGD